MQALTQFAEAETFAFRLLSDPDGSVVKKYGVLSERGYAKRVTFIVDDAGVLRHVMEKVDVRAHGTQILEEVRRLRK